MDDENCEHCNLDRITFDAVLPCAHLSIRNICTDIARGENIVTACLRDDRILYVLGIVIVAIMFRICLSRLS